jgi:hypothetical protein
MFTTILTHKSRMLLVTLALVGASVAHAQQQQGGDLCFHYASGGGTLVAKQGGGLPEPDRCKPLQFFEDGGLAGAATGSICADANGGRTTIFHYTYHSCVMPSHFQIVTCWFGRGLPAEGFCRGTDTQGGFVELATLESCDKPVPEAVAGLCAQ